MRVEFATTIRSTKGAHGAYPSLTVDWPWDLRLPVAGDSVRLGLDVDTEVKRVYLDPLSSETAATIYLVEILTDEDPAEYARREFPGWVI